MAKALLFLRAADNTLAQLQEVMESSLRAAFADAPHVTIQLMRAPQTDYFHDPASPLQRPDLTLEIVSAAGKPLGTLHEALSAVLAGLPIDPASEVYVMHERPFIPCEPQAFYYHYLMVRRADFSSADYSDYYSRFHSQMGMHTREIAGYSQNDIDGPASTGLAELLGLSTRGEVTSISELKMPSPEAFVGNPDTMAVAEPAAIDEERFVDRARSVSFSSQVILRLGDFSAIREPVHPQHFAPT